MPRTSDPLRHWLFALHVRPARLAMAVMFGVLALGSALRLAGLSAWLITRAWQMPPVLDLSVAVVAVRALGISRGIWRYCERLAGHDIALRGAAAVRTHVYARLTGGPAGRLRKGRCSNVSVPTSTNWPRPWSAASFPQPWPPCSELPRRQ